MPRAPRRAGPAEATVRVRAILTYHSIDESGSPVSVGAAVFRDHVRWLGGGRVKVLPLDELLRAGDHEDAVALTFDDAFRNFAEVAAPLLLGQGLPVTLFVVSDHVGGTNAWSGRGDSSVPTLPLCDWDTLATLRDRGVTIGSHSRRHPSLVTRRGAELEDEVAGCQARIAGQLGVTPRTFCYPYGSVDEEVAAVVRRTHAVAVTTELRALRPHEDPMRIPRLDMYYFRAPGALEAWGSPAFRGRLALRAFARGARELVTAPRGRA